jgi:hypothetical protein
VKLAKTARIVALGASFVAAGCTLDLFHRDQDALDRFSHAYTDFLDTGEVTESVWKYVGPDNDPFGFWVAFKGALDPNSYDAGRLAQAQAAIAVYEKSMPKALEAEAGQVDKLDKTVQRLFEAANAIHNTEYRADAVQVAKYAREAEASFALGHDLTDRRTRLQRRMLDDIVNAGGSLARAFGNQSLKVELDETIKISDQLQTAANRSTTAMRNVKDTLSALKGRTNLKTYALKGESTENAAGKDTR